MILFIVYGLCFVAIVCCWWPFFLGVILWNKKAALDFSGAALKLVGELVTSCLFVGVALLGFFDDLLGDVLRTCCVVGKFH